MTNQASERLPSGREHILKCWPNAFDAVASGAKTFEWRKDDRGFEVGDILVLRKWNPAPKSSSDYGAEGFVMRSIPGRAMLEYTELRVAVTYILRGNFGIPDGYCVMAIKLADAVPTVDPAQPSPVALEVEPRHRDQAIANLLRFTPAEQATFHSLARWRLSGEGRPGSVFSWDALDSEAERIASEERQASDPPEKWGYVNVCTLCGWSGRATSCPNCNGDRGLKLFERADEAGSRKSLLEKAQRRLATIESSMRVAVEERDGWRDNLDRVFREVIGRELDGDADPAQLILGEVAATRARISELEAQVARIAKQRDDGFQAIAAEVTAAYDLLKGVMVINGIDRGKVQESRGKLAAIASLIEKFVGPTPQGEPAPDQAERIAALEDCLREALDDFYEADWTGRASALLSRRDSPTSERDALRERVASLEAELAATKARETELEKDVNAFCNERPKLLEALEQVRQERDTLRSELTAARAELSAARERLAAFERDHDELSDAWTQRAMRDMPLEEFEGVVAEIVEKPDGEPTPAPATDGPEQGQAREQAAAPEQPEPAPAGPTYNHTRGDSPLTPCPICASSPRGSGADSANAFRVDFRPAEPS